MGHGDQPGHGELIGREPGYRRLWAGAIPCAGTRPSPTCGDLYAEHRAFAGVYTDASQCDACSACPTSGATPTPCYPGSRGGRHNAPARF